MKQWIKEIKKVNGKRRSYVVTLEEIQETVEKIVNEYEGKKKNLKYVEITNRVAVCNSYNYRPPCFTKWNVTLTGKGTIKTLAVTEWQAYKEAYGNSSIVTFISDENIQKISECKTENRKTLDYLEKGILKGEI